MPTKARLERKIADLRRELQTAMENCTEAQAAIEELQQEVTLRQNTLTDTVRERNEALESQGGVTHICCVLRSSSQ